MRKYNRHPGLKRIGISTRKAAPTYGHKTFLTPEEERDDMLVVDNDAEGLVSQMLGFDSRVRLIQARAFAADLVEGKPLRKYAGRKCPSIYTPDIYSEQAEGKELAFEVKLEGVIGDDAGHDRLEHVARWPSAHRQEVAHRVVPSFNKAYADQCA